MADLRDFFSLVPACAGVIPHLFHKNFSLRACPRVCGGDPAPDTGGAAAQLLSPRVRG